MKFFPLVCYHRLLGGGSVNENFSITRKQVEKFFKKTRKILIAIFMILLLVLLASIGFGLVTDYIWMDTLGFSDVFMTILSSKIMLGVTGFVLFFVLSYLTFYWIRLSYLKQFAPVQLPAFIVKGKLAHGLILLVSVLFGIFGSLIVKGIGWEHTLKFMNHEKFHEVDPYFGMDISFYMFQLPFIEFILFLLQLRFFNFLLFDISIFDKLFCSQFKYNKFLFLETLR